MVDIENLAGTPTIATINDFLRFRVGNADDTAIWNPAPTPIDVTLRSGEGDFNSDRVTIIWEDGTIKNTWLEVTVLAGATTGLDTDEVFYFGNAIGETGNSTVDPLVDFADRNATENAQTVGPVAIDNPFDFNRDGVVDAIDVAIVEGNFTALTGDLNKDDRVGLVDLAQLQARLGAVGVTDPYEGDLTGEGNIDRADVVAFLRDFGSTPTADALARRLALISPSAAQSPSAENVEDAVQIISSPSPSPAAALTVLVPTSPRDEVFTHMAPAPLHRRRTARLIAERRNVDERPSAEAIDRIATDDAHVAGPLSTRLLRARRMRRNSSPDKDE